jgi:hypothetical protein
MIPHTFVKTGILLSFCFLLIAAPVTAADEVIAIKEGTFGFESGEGRLDISGTRNFRLNALVFLHGGFFPAFDLCQLPECPPGTELELTARCSGLDVFGNVELRGRSFPTVSTDDVGVVFGFSGSVTLPAISGGTVTVSVPFDFAGTFGYDLDTSEPKQALLTGGGDATLTLVPHPEDNQKWLIEKIEFQFQPVDSRGQ